MPPYKLTRNKQTIKQKKLLKARLVRISMVIEDYLYKNKAVSSREARTYVEEVSKYKHQCVGDARSLQVIEKITRCMNSIIAEQQEDSCSSINFQHVSANYCPSPVYSIAEEDRTMLNQTPIIDLNRETVEKNNNDFETMEYDSYRNINVVVDIHRAMSNLSIKENDHTKNLNMNTIDCSQSILKDFNQNRAEEIKKTVAAKTLQSRLPKHNLSVYCNEQEASTECSQSVLVDFKQEKTKFANNSTTTKHRLFETNDQVSKKILKIPNEKNVSGNNNKQLKKKTTIKNVKINEKIESVNSPEKNYNKQLQKGNRKQKNKSVRQMNHSKKEDKVLKRKRRATDLNIKEPEVPVSEFSVTTGKTTNIHTINVSVNETVHQKTKSADICGLDKANNTIYNKSMAKIYNVNVENDLSWVENIRYVREVSTEEFDPKYKSLQDSFWENSDLPNDCDEKDFYYFD